MHVAYLVTNSRESCSGLTLPKKETGTFIVALTYYVDTNIILITFRLVDMTEIGKFGK